MGFEIYSIANINITENEPHGGYSDGFILRACVCACVRACVRDDFFER